MHDHGVVVVMAVAEQLLTSARTHLIITLQRCVPLVVFLWSGASVGNLIELSYGGVYGGVCTL